MRIALGLTIFALSTSLACTASTDDDSDSSTDDVVLAHGSSNVEILVEPGDNGSALIAAVTAATKSVHVTMYILADDDLIAALLDRKKKGVDVKVILNEHFAVPSTSNQAVFDKLHAAHIGVSWAPGNFTYTHEKAIVIDGKTAWIMTMNAAKTAFTRNREFLAIDNAVADVREAEAQFDADFAGRDYTPSGALLMSPTTMRPGLLALFTNANHTLDFEVEELSDPGIADAACAAVTRHVTVRGAISTQVPSPTSQGVHDRLKACGVKMVVVAHPYLHAKAIVADGAKAYVGSANFSPTSLDRNRELGVVTTTAAAVAKVAAAVDADITAGNAL